MNGALADSIYGTLRYIMENMMLLDRRTPNYLIQALNHFVVDYDQAKQDTKKTFEHEMNCYLSKNYVVDFGRNVSIFIVEE
jgi:hypothetical protein